MIAKLLGRRHRIELSEYTVQEWVRGIRADLDPLAPVTPRIPHHR